MGGDTHTMLHHHFPDTIHKWKHVGPTCLNRYITTLHPHLPIPDASYFMYLSPPVPGFIFTPAHLDGHGCQMSTHMVLFGGTSYNKVYSRTPQQIGSSGQMALFRSIMGVAPEGHKQYLPHSKRHEFYTNHSHHSHIHHQTIDPSVLARLESIGIFGDMMTVSPGELVVLPAGTFHAFLKCVKYVDTNINNNNNSNNDTSIKVDEITSASASPSTSTSTSTTSASTSPLTLAQLMPMLGYAGDNTYNGSGSDMKEIRYNIANMLNTQLCLRSVQQPVMAYIELGIFSLFNSNHELYTSDPYTITVMEALQPLYNAILGLEQHIRTRLIPRNYFIDTLNNAFPQDLLDADYACSLCLMGIVNLFAYSKTTTTSTTKRRFYCCRCIETVYKQSCKDIDFLYRFTATPVQ